MLDGLRGTPREHGLLDRGQRDDEHMWIQIAQGGRDREELIVTVVGLMALLAAGCGQKTFYMRRQDPVRERDD
jgi:hypothetical protein